jgi:hypothetical protein
MSEKPVNIEEKDSLTAYVSGMLGVRLSSLPTNMQEEMMQEAKAMSAVGVNSEEDHKDFMYVLLHTRKISEDISGEKLDPEILAKLSHFVFSNRIGNPIDTIFNFYRAVGKGLNEMGIPIKKTAYPTGQSNIRAQNPRNTKKWMKTMRELYFMVHHEIGYTDALDHLTAEWDVMEKNDFTNWMKFYEEGAHDKYKIAQDDDEAYLQMGGGDSNLVTSIPWNALRGKLKGAPPGMPNMNRYEDPKKAKEDDEEKEAAELAEQERLEARDKKVKSIGGRLRSALKLLSDADVQSELDGKLEISIADFVKMIQELQRYILLIPLKNKKSSIVEDLIIQRGNRLIAQGCPKAGELIQKFAQPAPPPVEELGNIPMPPDEGGEEATAPAPAKGEDAEVSSAPEGGDPFAGDEDPFGGGEDFEDESDSAWVQDFKNNLNNVKDDSSKSDDDFGLIDDLAFITVDAQAMPPMETPAEPMAVPEEEAAIEVEEEPDLEVEEEPDLEMTDPMEDPDPDAEMGVSEKNVSDLDTVTISDVVDRLERVSNILKNREIPRELAWIDFMLDKLGLASYFPGLAEATKSALESNQYMSTRVEDILSRLRGSIEPDAPLELTTTEPEESAMEDTLQQVRQNLDVGDQKERDRKEQRNKALDEGAPPAIPAEELAQPVNVETAPPTPVR